MSFLLTRFREGSIKVKVLVGGTIVLLSAFLFLLLYTVQKKSGDLKTYVESVQSAEQGMTLWQTIQAGGLVMVVLAGLSLVTISLVVYLFLHLKTEKLVPENFSYDLIERLKEQNYPLVRQICLENENLVTAVVLAGLNKVDRGTRASREAIELKARREVTTLWKPIGFLSDIAVVAPMIGLLGTVIGMIQAFNTIAFQTAVVKPILLAGGVSKAMVTTAGGMIIAIIAMIFYSLFRSQVQEITNILETLTSDILHVFPREFRHKNPTLHDKT